MCLIRAKSCSVHTCSTGTTQRTCGTTFRTPGAKEKTRSSVTVRQHVPMQARFIAKVHAITTIVVMLALGTRQGPVLHAACETCLDCHAQDPLGMALQKTFCSRGLNSDQGRFSPTEVTGFGTNSPAEVQNISFIINSDDDDDLLVNF